MTAPHFCADRNEKLVGVGSAVLKRSQAATGQMVQAEAQAQSRALAQAEAQRQAQAQR